MPTYDCTPFPLTFNESDRLAGHMAKALSLRVPIPPVGQYYIVDHFHLEGTRNRSCGGTGLMFHYWPALVSGVTFTVGAEGGNFGMISDPTPGDCATHSFTLDTDNNDFLAFRDWTQFANSDGCVDMTWAMTLYDPGFGLASDWSITFTKIQVVLTLVTGAFFRCPGEPPVGTIPGEPPPPPPSAFGGLEADSPRGWLHVGADNRVRTYYLSDWMFAFESDAYSAIDRWFRFRADSRRNGLLCMLGEKDPDSWLVFLSNDGGKSGTQVLSVTAKSAVIERDSEQGLLVFLWENGGPVQRQYSQDGGVTWTPAVAVTYNGGDLTGTLLDMTQDLRYALFALSLSQSGNVIVLSSNNWGVDWTLRLS